MVNKHINYKQILKDLVDQINVVQNSKEYHKVWENNQRYDGPYFMDQLEAAETALSNTDYFTVTPWGYSIVLHKTDTTVHKILVINPWSSTSYQYHDLRDEALIVLSGKGVLIKNEIISLIDRQSAQLSIMARERHAFYAFNEPLILKEIWNATNVDNPYLGEADIVRIHDPYNRK